MRRGSSRTRDPPLNSVNFGPAQSKLGIFTRLVKAKVDMDCFQGHGIEKEFPALVTSTVERQRLSFHVFVAVPMGRAFFRCRLF